MAVSRIMHTPLIDDNFMYLLLAIANYFKKCISVHWGLGGIEILVFMIYILYGKTAILPLINCSFYKID